MDRTTRSPLPGALLAIILLVLAGCAADDALPVRATEAPSIGAEMFHAADGAILPLRSWLPAGRPRAVILALHGFGDYSAAFRQPAGLWALAGIATYAYDQRGFGGAPHIFHWAGTAAMEADARAVAAALRARNPGVPLYLLGESMGGALAIVAAAGPDPIHVDGVILISPAIWEGGLMGGFERSALWLTRLTIPGLWLEAPRTLGIHPSDNIPMLRLLARDSLVQSGARADTAAGLMDLMDEAKLDLAFLKRPTLVLYGAHEEVLPEGAVDSALERLPAKHVTVALYPNGYHMLLRDLHGDVVARDILAWIEKRQTPLPSGDECGGRARRAPPCRDFRSPSPAEAAR